MIKEMITKWEKEITFSKNKLEKGSIDLITKNGLRIKIAVISDFVNDLKKLSEAERN